MGRSGKGGKRGRRKVRKGRGSEIEIWVSGGGRVRRGDQWPYSEFAVRM